MRKLASPSCSLTFYLCALGTSRSECQYTAPFFQDSLWPSPPAERHPEAPSLPLNSRPSQIETESTCIAPRVRLSASTPRRYRLWRQREGLQTAARPHLSHLLDSHPIPRKMHEPREGPGFARLLPRSSWSTRAMVAAPRVPRFSSVPIRGRRVMCSPVLQAKATTWISTCASKARRDTSAVVLAGPSTEKNSP